MDDYFKKSEVDLYRDTYYRYLGYANEIGESFRSLVHANAVRFSYFVAIVYVCADASDKGMKAARACPDNQVKNSPIRCAIFDTLVWQGLASVAIPGFTINRLCFLCHKLLKSQLPGTVRKWTVTGIGLASIPMIIKPIDHSVEYIMNQTVRKCYNTELMTVSGQQK